MGNDSDEQRAVNLEDEPIETRLYNIEETMSLVLNSLHAIEKFMDEFAPLARKAAELMSKTPAQAVREAMKRRGRPVP